MEPQYNHEVDSLAYFMQLFYNYWLHTSSDRKAFLGRDWLNTIEMIVDLVVREQNHTENSPYRSVKYTGMTWTGYRPSDDPCTYHYHVPSNAFLIVALGKIQKMLRELPGHVAVQSGQINTLLDCIELLRVQIDDGIHTYGVVNHSKYGRFYAYEVDGLGNHNVMDDANIPAICPCHISTTVRRMTQRARSTRQFVLSEDNPYLKGVPRRQGVAYECDWHNLGGA